MRDPAVVCFIGLGSNLENPRQQLERAIQSLVELEHCRVLSQSRIYHSPPLGPQDQPDYLNAVVKMSTSLDALGLLHALQAIEQSQGRRRNGQVWGPRTLDLDILLYGDEQISTSELAVPHPGLRQRAFVLYPLQDVEPELLIPSGDRLLSLHELITTLQQSGAASSCEVLSGS